MISLNEIKERANHFAITYKDAKREKSESQTFWNDFFNVFGIIRKKVATFEEPVKKLNNKDGFIDLFWKGKLIIEQKSLGKSLDDAILQANDYCANLKPSELPRYLLACDFLNFRLIDLEQKYEKNFRLDELADNIDLFGFISGYE